MVRRPRQLCLAGFLGGLDPIPAFMPVMQLPSGVHFSFFGSFTSGAPAFPTAEIPMQAIVERVEDGTYKAKAARVFRFDEIREAHRLVEAGAANDNIVVCLQADIAPGVARPVCCAGFRSIDSRPGSTDAYIR